MTINTSDRVWQMPFAAALASGLPLLVGAYFDHMDYGLVSSLGGLVFLYLLNTPLYHRMVSLMACAFAMIACYTLGVMSHFFFVVFDSVVIGVFVGISLALAQALQLENAYWVPVSCLAVIQGQSLRAVWNKQLHRVIGTGIGLLVAWGLLLLSLDKWSISVTMMVLVFVIEMAVVRHYGFAAIFITPLTILLVEAATLGQGSTATLIQARFFDTVLGCAVGFAGAVCLHSPRFRSVVGGQIRRLIPSGRESGRIL